MAVEPLKHNQRELAVLVAAAQVDFMHLGLDLMQEQQIQVVAAVELTVALVEMVDQAW